MVPGGAGAKPGGVEEGERGDRVCGGKGEAGEGVRHSQPPLSASGGEGDSENAPSDTNLRARSHAHVPG